MRYLYYELLMGNVLLFCYPASEIGAQRSSWQALSSSTGLSLNVMI